MSTFDKSSSRKQTDTFEGGLHAAAKLLRDIADAKEGRARGELGSMFASQSAVDLREAADRVEKIPAPVAAAQNGFSIEFYQQDFIPGFAAFLPNSTMATPDSRAFCVLNVGSLLATVHTGDVAPSELPYFIAESMMHEAVHALEQWAGVEFSEERIEDLLLRYRASASSEEAC